MKQEDKELLLKDLCARLPYGIKCMAISDGYIGYISSIESQYNVVTFDNGRQEELCDIRPYLFPLSSMTKEQEDEWYDVCLQPLIKRLDQHTRKEDLMLYAESQYAGSDWLNKNHFDYRDLIPKGLANDATGLNIY